MKTTTMYLAIWIICGLSATISVIATKSLMPLWVLVIPGFINITVREEDV